MADTSFFEVKCRDCGAEQFIFERAATQVSCEVCSATLAEPTGGRAKLSAEILEEHT